MPCPTVQFDTGFSTTSVGRQTVSQQFRAGEYGIRRDRQPLFRDLNPHMDVLALDRHAALASRGACVKRPHRPAITSPELGLIVRIEREAQRLSQAELAERAEMRIAQLSALENGRNMEIRFYEACAHALGYDSAAEMFAGGTKDRDRLTRQVKAQILRDLTKALK